MAHRLPTGWHRVTAGLLTAVTLSLSLGVTLLDARQPSFAAAVESRHDPETCPPPHDHRACSLLARGLAPRQEPLEGQAPCERRVRFTAHASVTPRTAIETRESLPRAPPA